MFYSNPAWYALAISIFALIVSGLTLIHRRQQYHHQKQKTGSEIRRTLTKHAVEINEGFARLGVKGPYAHYLEIPDRRVAEFTGKAVMLLNQLNLLRDVFQNRDLVGEGELEVYEKWASTILRPWIESDEELKKIWFLSSQAEDLRQPDFSDWLNGLLPILQT